MLENEALIFKYVWLLFEGVVFNQVNMVFKLESFCIVKVTYILSQILLEEFGFHKSFMVPLRTQYLMPLARLLFSIWVEDGLDSHKAFIVRYALGEDLDLSYHFDNAEVTLNVSLGKKFTGGDLYFGKMKHVSCLHMQW